MAANAMSTTNWRTMAPELLQNMDRPLYGLSEKIVYRPQGSDPRQTHPLGRRGTWGQGWAGTTEGALFAIDSGH